MGSNCCSTASIVTRRLQLLVSGVQLLVNTTRLFYGWRQVAEVILYVAEVILDVAEVILSFHEINGFLSLQLGLSFELGLRLRLTKKSFYN